MRGGFFVNDGRSGGIRTHDPHTPSVVRYQTALRSENFGVNLRASETGHNI